MICSLVSTTESYVTYWEVHNLELLGEQYRSWPFEVASQMAQVFQELT